MATPLPVGVQLLRTLTGHTDTIGRIGWSPYGSLLATPSMDDTVRLWDVESGTCLRIIRGHHEGVWAATFDPTGRVLATGGTDSMTNLWEVDSGKRRISLRSGVCYSVAFGPQNGILAIASSSSEVTLWSLSTGDVLYRLIEHDGLVRCMAFNASGGILATGDQDGVVRLWEIPGGRKLRTLNGHTKTVFDAAFHPGNRLLATAGDDRTVRIWDAHTGTAVSILEGHTDGVRCLSFSRDGRVLASKSVDGTVRLWDTKFGWKCKAILPAPTSGYWAPSVAFHPRLPILATVGSGPHPATSDDFVVHLWKLDTNRLFAHTTPASVSYKTAKIVLVGESGVGKTGLGWRLAHGEFIEHTSTHGQQFWLLDELGATRADGTERDAILWDLAGQPDYRLIHALYVDDADLALVLFDSTHGDEPLRGVEYWLRQLGRDRPIILVAARSDRGAPRLTTEEIEAFCADRGIEGYVATSALQGDGLDDLVKRMRAAIRWDDRPTTVTTQTFKRIKAHVLELKEGRLAGKTILSPGELRVRLEREHAAAGFADDELLTAVGHLSHHGYVAYLRTSRGESRILLAPVLLNNLAASIILEARRNPKGLGSLEEQRVLTDGYGFPELATLSTDERGVLLDSAIEMFLAHSVCFRETDPLTARSYLVFPELINLKKPLARDEQCIEEGPAYTASGAVSNVYASLVVLLGYTSMFTRTNQWHNHARYVVGDGLVCGLRVEAEGEGELDFVLYFGATVGAPVRTLFQSLIESFLGRREVTVRRYQVVQCIEGHQLNRAVIREQLAAGANYAFCPRCGKQVVLPLADIPIELTQKQKTDLAGQRWTANQRLRFEQVLFRLKTYVTQEGLPTLTCFISYAWGDDHDERWVRHIFATDLLNAGITVVLDRWENTRIGASVSRFVERIAKVDRVIVVGTPRYRIKYENAARRQPSATGASPPGDLHVVPTRAFVVAAEGDLIAKRMLGSEADKESILPVLVDGTPESSFPPLLQGRVYADFRRTEQYFSQLFNLVLSLYQISPHEPIRDLMRKLDERY